MDWFLYDNSHRHERVKREGLKNIKHSIGMVLRHKLIQFLESAVLTVSYLVHYDTLLQNVKYIITKCDGHFITKC